MVIKYKAKYIRDGEVVIDDTTLIELGSSEKEKASTAEHSRPKSRGDLEQMIAQSEERSSIVECSSKMTTGSSSVQGASAAQGTNLAQSKTVDSDDSSESADH